MDLHQDLRPVTGLHQVLPLTDILNLVDMLPLPDRLPTAGTVPLLAHPPLRDRTTQASNTINSISSIKAVNIQGNMAVLLNIRAYIFLIRDSIIQSAPQLSANNIFLQFGYKKEDIVTLTDDQTNHRAKPTRENIIAAMQWLIRDAAPNDSLFFHYSGHGGQTKDLDGDEADGFDEVIYPVDFKQNGHIVDDLLHNIMVKPLPAGCRLTAIFDSCHSGSVLDLPYIYSTEGKIKEPNLAAEAGQGLLSAVTSYARGDMSGVFQSAIGLVKTMAGGQEKADKITKATRTSPADAISWSGCKDSQTSADTQEKGQATGAMSYAFIAALSKNKQQSYQSLLVNIRDILKSKYEQKPQLSSSHPIDTKILFVC
ncbi:Ca(2+)-dependent cysteine protease [Blastosporella zonata]|nr:Ca(2+)-dependent cysteine protease [Blastosporella zonata]